MTANLHAHCVCFIPPPATSQNCSLGISHYFMLGYILWPVLTFLKVQSSIGDPIKQHEISVFFNLWTSSDGRNTVTLKILGTFLCHNFMFCLRGSLEWKFWGSMPSDTFWNVFVNVYLSVSCESESLLGLNPFPPKWFQYCFDVNVKLRTSSTHW